MEKTATPKNVDEYINRFPKETQKILKQVRAIIKKAAPKAEEYIGYQMPGYKLNGMLVYFAGYNKHIGFYPGASGIANFKKEISTYKWAKGSIQFPLDEPMPVKLIEDIVKFRLGQNMLKAKEGSENFLSQLSAPARRALESKGILTLKKLSTFRESDLLELHGFGPSAIPKLKQALKAEGLEFKK